MHAAPMNGTLPAGHYKSGSMLYRMTGKKKEKSCRFRTPKKAEQSVHFQQLLLASFHLYRPWSFSDI